MAYLPPLDGVIRVTSVFGLDRGSYRHGGTRPGAAAGVGLPPPGQVAGGGNDRGGLDDRPAEHTGAVGAERVSLWQRRGAARRRGCAVAPTALRRAADGSRRGARGGRPDARPVRLHRKQHRAPRAPGRRTARRDRPDDLPRARGSRVDPLRLYAAAYARDVGYDPEVFRRQIAVESTWNPLAVSRAGAEGLAQIIPRWHPAMRGRTFDPFAALDYAARLMAAHLDHRSGDYREALADYNTGRGSSGALPCAGLPLRRQDSGGLEHDANGGNRGAAAGPRRQPQPQARGAGDTSARSSSQRGGPAKPPSGPKTGGGS